MNHYDTHRVPTSRPERSEVFCECQIKWIKNPRNIKNYKISQFSPNNVRFPTGHNFQNILILKHDFKYCLCTMEGFSLIFDLSLPHKCVIVISKIQVRFGTPCNNIHTTSRFLMSFLIPLFPRMN